jgi:hypothetical protein
MVSRTLVLVFVKLIAASHAGSVSYYVAPSSGLNSGNGTSALSPFRSIFQAQQASRSAILRGDLPTVHLLEGLHLDLLEAPHLLEFTSVDSGTTWIGDPGAVILGAVPIPASAFSPVNENDKLWLRFDTAARDSILRADITKYLPEYHPPGPRGRELGGCSRPIMEVFDSQARATLTRARWPNKKGSTSTAAKRPIGTLPATSQWSRTKPTSEKPPPPPPSPPSSPSPSAVSYSGWGATTGALNKMQGFKFSGDDDGVKPLPSGFSYNRSESGSGDLYAAG